jgi:hypothetical protein
MEFLRRRREFITLAAARRRRGRSSRARRRRLLDTADVVSERAGHRDLHSKIIGHFRTYTKSPRFKTASYRQ